MSKIKNIYKMIDYVFDKTYGAKYISFSYFISIFLYSKMILNQTFGNGIEFEDE